jgi:hypothetical protein
VEIIFDSKTTFSKNLQRQPTVLIARDSSNDSDRVNIYFWGGVDANEPRWVHKPNSPDVDTFLAEVNSATFLQKLAISQFRCVREK